MPCVLDNLSFLQPQNFHFFRDMVKIMSARSDRILNKDAFQFLLKDFLSLCQDAANSLNIDIFGISFS